MYIEENVQGIQMKSHLNCCLISSLISVESPKNLTNHDL